MSRLDDVIGAALAGDLGSIAGAAAGEPRPVAVCRLNDRAVVLALVRRADGSLHAIVTGAYPRSEGGWEAGDLAQVPWFDARPDVVEQAASMRLDQMQIAAGAAPPGIDRVHGRLQDQTTTVDVHPETGAFVVACLAPEDAGPIELRPVA